MEALHKWINNQILSEDFHNILHQTRHNGKIYPPEKLQDFLINLIPFRFSLKTGINLQTDPSLWWFISDLGIPKSALSMENSMDQDLALLGFRLEDKREFNRIYKNKFLGERCEMRIQGPHPFQGGSVACCGLDLYLTIHFSNTKTFPYSQWTQHFPQLEFSLLNKEIRQILDNFKPLSISHGGTWKRYYSLSLKFPLNNKAALEQVIHKKASEGKYELFKKQANQEVYQDDFMMIYLESDKNCFQIRFQPT